MHFRVDWKNSLESHLTTRSRIHKLKSFQHTDNPIFIKRDDELSFLLSGSKVRKYASLLPALIEKGVKNVILIGGPFSNHITSFTQLLIQEGITPHLLLIGSAPKKIFGNYLLTRLMIKEENITWVPKEEWADHKKIAKKLSLTLPSSFVIDEGGSIKESLLGALTLPLDTLRNEEENCRHFDHIFIEAGSGMMASALSLYLSSIHHPATVHTLLLADDEPTFLKKLKVYKTWMEEIISTPIPPPKNLKLHRPTTLKSFGSTSKNLFKFISQFAQDEGLFLDPIYSGKLFFNGQDMMKDTKGHCLFIHSGGTQTLSGFQEQLAVACV